METKDEAYYFHQTPNELCIELIKEVPLVDGDNVLEPFRGEGTFFNNLPDNVFKDWTEIVDGRDYRDYHQPIDWVISNPPFRLESKTGRVNSFFYLLNHYASRVNKGIAFLGNDIVFGSLTPKRLLELQEKNDLFIHRIIVCNVKKWRGRYFFIIFKKGKCDFYKPLIGSY